MRRIILYSIIFVFISSCSANIAREAGKAVKVLDKTIQTNKNKKEAKKKLAEQKNKVDITIIGKSQNQLVSILGSPSLTREDGEFILVRFDRKDCMTFVFFNKQKNLKGARYFEFRNKDGEIINNKSKINNCFITSSAG